MREAGRGGALSRKPQVAALRTAGRGHQWLALGGIALALAAAGLLAARGGGRLLASAESGATPTLPTCDLPTALALLGAGLMLLVVGWPLYRLTATLCGLLLGAFAAGGAGWLAAGGSGALIGGFLGALLGALAAWPAEVLLRTLLGAAAGLTMGLSLGAVLGGPAALTGCGLGGLLLGGALTFLIYRTLMMAVTSVIGAALLVYAGLSLWRPGEDVPLEPLWFGAAAGLAVLGFLAQASLDRPRREKAEE
jgi:hypothetical protein